MAINRNTVIVDAAITFAAGTVLGAVVALLVAPQSGRKTRRDIRRFARRGVNKAEAAKLELQHCIDKVIGEISAKVEDGLAGGMDWTDSRIADLRQTLEAAGKSILGEFERIRSTGAEAISNSNRAVE
jgi:gas vesicle protein